MNPDPALVKNLAAIVNRTNAQIVVSSTWRLDERLMLELEKALALEDMKIFDCTPDHSYDGDRVDEIAGWLTEHQPNNEKWIAIDDMHLANMNPDKMPEKNFVLTTDFWGLQE